MVVARQQLKPLLGLFAFLIIWWLLPPFVSRFTKSSFYEFQAPFSVATSHAHDLQKYWSLQSRSQKELIEDGRDLARLNADYALRLPAKPGFRYEIARVSKRNLTAWWQQLIIRKGANYDIPLGAAVVYAGGVVGRVCEVHAYTAVVELVSSPGYRMAAHIQGANKPVTYQGLPNKSFASPRGEVLNVPPDIHVSLQNPRRLVSSGLGGVFPEGLFIGDVTSLAPGSDGYFQYGMVQLNPQLSQLQELAIMIPVEG